MLMADTMAIFLVVLGLLLAFPGLWLLLRGLWPGQIERTAVQCRTRLFRSFLVGLPLSAAVILLALGLGNRAGTPGKIAAISLVCLYLLFAHTGVAGLATCIGERLKSPADAGRPWMATLRGGIALELSYLLPILGWFGILPASFIAGCGAASLALAGRESAEALPAPEEPEAGGDLKHPV